MVKHLKARFNRLALIVVGLGSLSAYLLFFIFNPLGARANSFLRFDESNGTTVKSYQNNTTGTITGATWKPKSECVSGSCLFFDGTGDFVNFGDDSNFDFLAATSWTIELWFRHAPKASGTDVLVAKANATAGYKIQMESDGDITFAIDDDATWTPDDSVTSTAATYDDNKWHHVAAVKTGTTKIELFIDGQSVGTDSSIAATGTLANTASLYIGVDGNGSSNYFTGYIDEVNIYGTTAKTSTTIRNDAQKGATQIGNSAIMGTQTSALTEGLVGWWKMDEISWTNDCSTAMIVDDSGNGNHGKSCPNTTGPTGATLGKFGRVGTFDGSDDYLDIPSSTSLDNIKSKFTVSAWIKTSAASTNQGILAKRNSNLLIYNYAGNNQLRFFVFTDNVYADSLGTTTLLTDTWYHVAATYSDSAGGDRKVKLYLNGVEEPYVWQNAGTGTVEDDSTYSILVGKSSNSDKFSGKIDDVRIYNRVLSPSEIRELYNYAPGPVGLWKFDDNAGNGGL